MAEFKAETELANISKVGRIYLKSLDSVIAILKAANTANVKLGFHELRKVAPSGARYNVHLYPMPKGEVGATTAD